MKLNRASGIVNWGWVLVFGLWTLGFGLWCLVLTTAKTQNQRPKAKDQRPKILFLFCPTVPQPNVLVKTHVVTSFFHLSNITACNAVVSDSD